MSIVGYITKSGNDYLPTIWTDANAKPTPLPILDGYTGGLASGINNLGQIVGILGQSDFSNVILPVIWTDAKAKPTPLQILDGYVNGTASSINNLGQIVGFLFDGYRLIPVIWTDANVKPTPLPLLDGYTGGTANGINDLGQIVGDNYPEDVPVIWTDVKDKPTPLPLLDGYTGGTANGINDLGQIVGDNYPEYVPVIWTDVKDKPTPLPLLVGYTSGFAFGINNLGQIVGDNYPEDVPVIWTDVKDKPTPLPLLEGYTSGSAYGISDPSTPAISNICFPAGTPVQTDQGIINIDALDPQTHTIASQPILHITHTTTLDTYLISFDKNCLERNVPSRKTLMTKDHKIMFKDRLVPAYRFLDFSDKIKKVKYSGETLYNVLLSEHGTINVNNLLCETLHPDNIIAKLYMRETDIKPLTYQLNAALKDKDFPSYSEVVHRLKHNL